MSHSQAQASLVRWACLTLGWDWAWTYRSESIAHTARDVRPAAAND